MEKSLLLIRHGQKTEDGKHITEECLSQIKENGIPGLTEATTTPNVIHLGTGLVRTEETVLAIETYLENLYGTEMKKLPASADLGSDEMFADMFPDMRPYADKSRSYVAIWQEIDIEAFTAYGNNLVSGIRKHIFDKMESGDTAISINHTPLIELAYCTITGEKDCSNMGELQGIEIKLIDDKLTATLLQ